MNGFQARDFPPGFQPQQHQNHLQQQLPRPSLSPNNHWLNPMQPNPHPHFNQQQQQPQLNSAWMNQMQQFSSGMSAMGFNPLIQQQLFQDALAMSQPVEAADEPLIVQVLLSAKKKKESYKEALNNLHGRNGHSASLWKDYYLDHKDHIDTWINMCLEKEKSHHRRPPPDAVKREYSPARLPLSAPVASKKRKHSSPSTSATPVPLIGRSTLNSLSVPQPVYNDQMPAPNSELKIPDPPTRSPSPPTRVIPQGRGNKYTEEDRHFFLQFISWRLKQDPSLTRNDLCNMLAEKAPHHSAMSWASHWSNRHDLPDKILAAARGESYVSDEDDDEDDDEPELIRPTKRRPQYRDLTTEDEDEEDEDEDDGQLNKPADDDDDGDDGDDDNEAIHHYTENQMGQKGEPFTEADLYMASKHAAKYNQWLDMSSKDRWESFSEQFQQRSAKSWAEYYRRNEDNILRLRKKLRKEVRKATSSNGTSMNPAMSLNLPSQTLTPH
ncbi:hypothetical protein AGABI1DRAFT_123887 [Agaricus bisporus var. burnettii JB137-S8]|uniref:Uncharacterized protein n=1 Tax=Agaricus bisporus var. burnettii (strain JB137-S8 / ATCC MYA-4627 / FGSC 10392) TaxID=597362 RepID=K5W9M2_AGABU|nr:uncharacterized protein AGABI1DRAFT_123887 [Agaricus bisporus var. burnettii JB137-S8]EKM83559.1 hypothetical protein AGABI1DRAFT_123887 [Agaricus bisporus var. burnettii JB137-S8]